MSKKLPAGHEIALGLRRAYAFMHRQTQSLLSPHGVTADQFVLLDVLNNEDGLTQNVITQRASSDPNTVRAMLVLLEKKGLVLRNRHDTDRRARQVLITSRGRRLHAKLLVVLHPLQAALAASFTNQEVNALIKSLDLVAEAMTQWELRAEKSKAS